MFKLTSSRVLFWAFWSLWALWAPASGALPVAKAFSGSSLPAADFVSGPTLVPNPNPAAPLAARIFAQTDEPAVLHLQIDDGEKVWTETPVRVFSMEHEVPLLGLRPDREHQVTVFAKNLFGAVTASVPLTFWTPPLPPLFPPFETTVSQQGLMEPGVTLMNVILTHPSIASGDWGVLVMLDAVGELIWYYSARHQIVDARRLSNGNILYLGVRHRIVEINMFGDIVGQWWAAAQTTEGAPADAVLVPVDSFHHEVFELPASYEGDFVVLSTELRNYANYPADESNPSVLSNSSRVVGDVVVEFRRDGSIVRQYRLLDVLDPYRISYDSLNGFWDSLYGVPTADWGHANAVILDAPNDAWIVSVRNQEAVVRLSRSTPAGGSSPGQLDWILGPPAGWQAPWSAALLTPMNDSGLLAQGFAPFEWNYHQHAPQLLPDGSLVLFDNGNGRAVAPETELSQLERYSRAVRFSIDEEQRSVTQLWSYGSAQELWYSGFLGDADLQPMTHNVLVADGGKADGQRWGRIAEVTRAADPVLVFEVLVREQDSENGIGWNIYRAERLSSVYP